MAQAKQDFISSLASKLGFNTTEKKPATPVYPTPTGAPITKPVTSTYKTPSVKPTTSIPTINQSATSPAKDQFANMLKSTYSPQVLGTTATTAPTASISPSTPSSTTTQIQTPQTPKIDTTGRDTAFQNYLDTLKQSAAEKEAKQKETEARSKYLDFVTSAESGIAGLEGQGRGIPLSIVRGQQEKLGKQAEITAKRLQGDIGLAQDLFTSAQQEREGLSAAEKAKYDYQNALIEEARAQGKEDRALTLDEAMTLGVPFGTKLSEATAQGIIPKETASDTGFTLGKDQVRYDAQGNVIAQNLTTPDGTPLTQSQAAALGYAERVNEAGKIIDQIGNQFTGVLSGIPVPNIVKSAERQQFEQAKRNFINAVLRRESGAAISPSEFDNAEKQYFPRAGDSDAVLEQKKANRETVLRNLMREGGQNNYITSEEEKFLQSKGYSQQEIEAYKKGKSFNSVGNTTASNIPQRNKNPGNVKQGGIADNLAVGTDPQGHLIFPDPETGFIALRLDLQSKINGQSRYVKANPTIAELGEVYAEDPNWSKSVASILGLPITTKTATIPIEKLTQAIARQEGFYA